MARPVAYGQPITAAQVTLAPKGTKVNLQAHTGAHSFYAQRVPSRELVPSITVSTSGPQRIPQTLGCGRRVLWPIRQIPKTTGMCGQRVQ